MHKQLRAVSCISFWYGLTPAQFSKGESGFNSLLNQTNIPFFMGAGEDRVQRPDSEIVCNSELGYVTRLNLCREF